jgi:hypothetical protein
MGQSVVRKVVCVGHSGDDSEGRTDPLPNWIRTRDQLCRPEGHRVHAAHVVEAFEKAWLITAHRRIRVLDLARTEEERRTNRTSIRRTGCSALGA